MTGEFQLEGWRGGSKDKVLRHFGFSVLRKHRHGYTVYSKRGVQGTIDVVGSGRGAMWYHKTGEPAKNSWTAAPIFSFGSTARDLYDYLRKGPQCSRAQ